MNSVVPVAVTGWGWGTGLLALLNVLIGGVCVALVRAWPSIRKLNNEREANLLEERAADVKDLRERLARVEAERAVDRHRLNNVTQCLDALLLLIEQDPNKAKEAASKIREMRADQMKAEAVEKGAISGASIKT